ncbi:MAG: hypothetical protein C0459_02430 [Chitinophaga sp.]|jgi:S1-C subfamily serine protease|nr:hypothetical protein [Chitinophaga sp.]
MDKKNYYIQINQETKGPYDLDTLQLLKLNGNTLVWHEDAKTWVLAKNHPDFFEILSLKKNKKKSKTVLIVLGIVTLLVILFFTYKGKNKQSVLPSYSNQELYQQFSGGVVLIKNKFIFRVTIGDKVFFFNHFESIDDFTYVDGLTEDSLKAVRAAEYIEGTGFFISKDGKILTNRHVAGFVPAKEDLYAIKEAVIKELSGSINNAHFKDSLLQSKKHNDSLLAVLNKDSANNLVAITDLKEKIATLESFLEEDGEYEKTTIDSAALENIKINSNISVQKITLSLKAYLQGSSGTNSSESILCNTIAISDFEPVDLAILQTKTKNLPDTSIHLLSLKRIKQNIPSTMSERLILIGYNRGSELAETTQGLQAQLTEGKVSQNNDAYKLMYTIPTMPGSSGSPVFDEKGNIVSVNFAGIINTQSFNYGIQTKQIKYFLESNGL